MSTAMQLPLTAEQVDWLHGYLHKNGIEMAPDIRTRDKAVNPCLEVYGNGPAGQTCKHCKHLYRHRLAKTYIKCDLRAHSNGPATDHKAGWPACGKFEEAKA